MKFPRYRVVNETGISNHTKVIDLETGATLAIRKFDLHFQHDNVVWMTAELDGIEVDASVSCEQLRGLAAKS